MLLDEVGAPTLLEALPDPAIVIDGDGWIVAGNRAANDLLATNRTPAGANVVDFLPEHERSRLNPLVWLKRWAEQPEAPELAHVRLWCRDNNGVDKPVRVRVGRLPADADAYLVTLIDVTEEQARQYRTRSAHRLAARVLAISADAILHVDEHGSIVYANPSAEKLFGYPTGELVGEPLASLLPPRHRDRHETLIRSFAHQPVPSRLIGERAEIAGLTRAGEEIPLEAAITRVTTDRGLIFSANLRDLRPRRAAEAALARSEARFRTVFDHAGHAMAVVGADERVEAINRAARALLPDGVEPVGASLTDLPWFVSASDAGAARAALRQVLAGGTWRGNAVLELPDGSEAAFAVMLSPVASEDGVFAAIAEAHPVAPVADGA